MNAGTGPRMLPILWFGLACIALSCAGWWIDRRMFAACWLAAWWWSLGLVLGAAMVAWIHALTGGRWGLVLMPAIREIRARMPIVAVLLVPIALMLPLLYPWRADPDGWSASMSMPGFARAWLSPAPFVLRMVIYALAWLWLARPRARPEGGGCAAVSLLAHMILGSLAAVDLLASLVPAWSSSVFGLLALTGQLVSGSAIVIALTAWLRRADASTAVPGKPPVWRDFGNLMLMNVSLWGYLAFMQFLVIWAENLPREISWFVPRLQTGWSAFAVVLVACNLVLPLLALLLRKLKDHPRPLGLLAAGLVVAQMLDAAWMVLPSVEPHSLHAFWLAPLLFIGFAALVLGPVPRRLALVEPSAAAAMQEARHAA